MKFLTLSLGLLFFAFTAKTQEIQHPLFVSEAKPLDPLVKLKNINRNFDGTQNNLNNPQWGSVNSELERLCQPNYADGLSKMWQNKPNVREVDTMVGSVENYRLPKDKNGINSLLPIFGQFLDHDITFTTSNKDEPVPIKVPMCDLHFDPECKGNIQLPFSRSISNPNKKVRTNLSIVSAWIDASQIYGCSKEKADSLRAFKQGKLSCSQGEMLMKDESGFYMTGDFRANQNIGLASIHTVFMRQHNRICDIIAKKYPKLCDEQIYTIARNYVIGLLQHIVYDQYLPLLLGEDNFEKYIGCYDKYNDKISPNIITEFSTAGYRLHSLVWYPFTMVDDNGKVVKKLQQGEMLSNPALMTSACLGQIFNGMISNPMKQRTIQLTNELRNGLILGPDRSMKFDLYAANLQRGRDHGICSIPAIRKALCLQPKQKFTEIFQSHHKAHRIQKLYQQLSNVDLYLAILGQKTVDGAVLGEIGIRLDAMQFKKIRDGDRFWYENAYPQEIVKEIKKTSFADVLKRNAGIRDQYSDAFERTY